MLFVISDWDYDCTCNLFPWLQSQHFPDSYWARRLCFQNFLYIILSHGSQWLHTTTHYWPLINFKDKFCKYCAQIICFLLSNYFTIPWTNSDFFFWLFILCAYSSLPLLSIYTILLPSTLLGPVQTPSAFCRYLLITFYAFLCMTLCLTEPLKFRSIYIIIQLCI